MTASPAALTALAGAVLGGALVGFAQQRVLCTRLPMARAGSWVGAIQALVPRRHVRRAGVWLWAHALAWGAAMPLLFAGMELVPWQTGGALATCAVCAAAGMAAGAVHGVSAAAFNSPARLRYCP